MLKQLQDVLKVNLIKVAMYNIGRLLNIQYVSVINHDRFSMFMIIFCHTPGGSLENYLGVSLI